MNAAVRAVVRMGLYVGAKVYFIHEVNPQIYHQPFYVLMSAIFYVKIQTNSY